MTRKSVPQLPTDGWETPGGTAQPLPGDPTGDEATHRYGKDAAADIRTAIAQARAASDAGQALPAMATTDAPVAEITERYTDRSVAGIRAAIAAARDAEHAGQPRAPGRFAIDPSQESKVPSMILEPRPQTPADDDPEAP